MGNKILGKRSRSFYKGFNDRQMDYLRQKFEMISNKGILDPKKFMESYKLTKQCSDNFFMEVDFDEDSEVDEYEFICAAHSLCSCTIEQLGKLLYRILVRKKNKNKLTSSVLLLFTRTCLQYNNYLNKTNISQKQIEKINKNKFEKYDYDKNKEIDEEEFTKICLKDEDYKAWMFNMGFITKRQLQFQEDIYDLVDSDICDEVDRNCQQYDEGVGRVKKGIQHRIEDDEFDLEQVVGEQSAPASKPWKNSIRKLKIELQNLQPPNQTLQIEHIFGYRSFDCRNNIKFNTKGQVVYHQAAVGIVLQPKNNTQSFIIEHHDDISCLDLVDDTVVTGQVGTNPQIILWQSIKEDNSLRSKMIITEQLTNSVANICLGESKNLLAAVCNDENHHLIIYDLRALKQKRENPTTDKKVIIASGSSTKNIVFDLKFQLSQNEKNDSKIVVVATLRQILFISFDKGTLNTNRGIFGNFTVSPTYCLEPLRCTYKGEQKQYMVSGMGNGSIYFWEEEKCVKAVCGHSGSVSALARRKETKSFVSGDKTGKVIVWSAKFEKQNTIIIPKTNCPSNMIVSLSCNAFKEMIIGTKASQMYIMGIKDSIQKAERIMSGHSDGHLWALTLHRTKPYLYTGGQDQRLIMWEYVKQRKIIKQRKCPYKIKSIDFNYKKDILAVGYQNGVIQCFNAQNLEKTELQYTEIKNPDEEVLNMVKFNKEANLCAASYLLPQFHIALLSLESNKIKKISEINQKCSLTCKVIALDFERESKYLRINTQKFQYLLYDISDPKKPELKPAETVKQEMWATNTLPFSAKTQGIMTEGVIEEDICCCERQGERKNVFVIGDKYSKIKLFNSPSVKNQIFSKYSGHSNEITGLRFARTFNILVSIGGQEKSIMIWKYDPDQVKNQEFIEKMRELQPESELEEKQLDPSKMKNQKLNDQFAIMSEVGEQRQATVGFLGQIKKPSDFQERYNSRKHNRQPEEDISLNHAFGIRNKYLKDQVRNQCKFTSSYSDIVFPTACLGVKMSLKTKEQQFYHEHKEDIVSFAIDSKRQLIATGQMAEKNPYAPRKKILSIYVWDIQGKKVLQKLDGFHTIAIVLLSFSPNSKFLFTCGNDDKNTFAVYDWMSGSILYSGPVSRAKVNGISWKNDNEFLTCGMDHVKFWTGKKSHLGKIKGKSESMFSCVSSKRIYITGGKDGLFNWTGNISSNKIKGHKGKVHTLIFHKDYVYSGADDGKILAWRTENNGEIKLPDNFFDTRNAFQSMLKQIPEEEFGVLSIDFSPTNELLIVTKGASVILHSNKNSQIVHQGHWKGQNWGLATQIKKGEDRIIATTGDDKTVRLWDLSKKEQVKRIYFDEKIRGIDWSRNFQFAVADSRAKVYLLNRDLSIADQYTGQPYVFNKKQKNHPWVQQIKFSPDGKMLAYGCHGKSMYMEFLQVSSKKLKNHKTFTQGSSAVLHIDWDQDSSLISLNTQAPQLLFYDTNGSKIPASATADTQYATWTQKFGFPVQGIFQGVDYTDINTVCRDPSKEFLAAGYDDQCIRLFKYPCYIEKQVCKTFTGHSSHVTRIKFTSEYMVSVGGLDRTILVWDVIRPQKEQEDEDGLDEPDEDVDVNIKAITKPPKKKVIEQFYEQANEGDQFMAVKPWLGAIKEPTYQYPQQTTQAPPVSLQLTYVHGYRCKDARQNLFYIDKNTILFHAAAVVIEHEIKSNTQHLMTDHNDDILSIDYHKETNTVLSGQLGPKPILCMYKDGKLDKIFSHPVKKGVLSISINHDGSRAVCVGMDDDHHIALLDLNTGKKLSEVKGSKKLIMKILWTQDNEFVTLGINHYKYWRVDNSKMSGDESRKRGNYVSAVYDKENKRVFTGASGGVVRVWKGKSNEKDIVLKGKSEDQKISVVDCLTIEKQYLLAGTKNGNIFVIKKNSKEVVNSIDMKTQYKMTDVKSEDPGVRAISIFENKMVVGTLGAEIYEFKFRDLEKDNKLGDGRNILKCHYSPNKSWTNEVWGLHVHQDYIFTCSDDATVRCWSIQKRMLVSCQSLNVGPEGQPLQKDKRTKDYSDGAKGRAVCLSPDQKQVIVGCKNGIVRVYSFDNLSGKMKFKSLFRHAKQWISDIKFAYNTLIIGSHDNGIYVYNYENGEIKRKYRPLKKHSSYITHMDASRDSCFLQSTCGAYQLLFWDLNTGKQLTSGASMLKDERWSTWTCNLGWPVQGIYPKCTDGTYINAVDRSHLSINGTLAKDDPISHYLLAAGNDDGKLAVYNYPCTKKSSKYVTGRGHSSHVTNVKWSEDDQQIITVGGEDQCLMYWKVKK